MQVAESFGGLWKGVLVRDREVVGNYGCREKRELD